MPGTSYRADEHEAIVREVLADVSLGAEHIAAVNFRCPCGGRRLLN